MKVSKIIQLFCAVLPLSCFSAEKTIICESPQGTRVDYFTANRVNLKNETFIMGRDGIRGMQPRIVFAENGVDVSFTLGDTETWKTTPKEANMKVVNSTEEQVSFAGLYNGAPILASYYPRLSILIYSQQSVWPGPDFAGARAAIFYSHCKSEA